MVGAIVPGTTGCSAQEPGRGEQGQVHYTGLSEAVSPGVRCQEGKMAWGCKYLSSKLFIENVQLCECEINVLNSLGVLGCLALNDTSSLPRPEEPCVK